MVVTVLTVVLTAAFIMVSAEFRTTDNAASSVRAVAIAEAGLQNYLSLNRGLVASTTYDSLRVTVTGGYADVVAQRIRNVVGGTPSLWSIRATGFPTEGLLSGTPSSRRTIGSLAHFYPGQLPARAGMIALNGVQILSGSGTNPFDGSDHVEVPPGANCPGWPGSPASDSFALSVVSSQYVSGGVGAPNGKGLDLIYSNRDQLYDTTHINWPAVTDSTFANFTPDYVLPGGTLPPATLTHPSNYTVGYAAGSYTLMGWSNSAYNPRRGVLVVGGNLTMNNNTHWDGVILVGGQLIIPTGATQVIIDGQIVTGLNYYHSNPVLVSANQIPRTPDKDQFRIAWSWCYSQIAAQSLSGFAPVRRAWTDAWALY